MTVASSYRLVNGSDTLTLSGTNAASPILVLESEFTPAQPRVVDQDRLGRSGKRDLTSLHDSSEFSARLRIQGDGDLSRYEYLDQLKTFLVPHKRPYLYVSRDGWFNERRALVRGNGVSCVVTKTSATWLEVSLRVSVPDGALEANESKTVRVRPGASNVGWSYPFAYPNGYTPSNSSNQATITLLGNLPVSPYIRIYGECSNPRLFRVSGGVTKELSLNAAPGLALAAGSYLDLDFPNRRVFLNGTPADSFYSRVDFATSEWWELEEGSNLLLFTATSADDGCYADITYRDTWTP